MSRPAISVENLSKAYRIGLQDEIPDSLMAAASGWARAPFRNLRRLRRLNTFEGNGHDADDVLWALKDVTFEVPEGEVLGVIGRNGAGKSTLLKVLSRITEPTSGRALIRGRVSSLLEVGTGFHDELTGRENVYMNATILGMTKREIDRRFDEIVDFSGVAKFLDTPVKRYSSGMKVRLAFGVAAHLEPEILIIDEVLAVGDAEFQSKCLGKMHDVAAGGRTVLFVSHAMAAVQRLCGRCILLEDGSVSIEGTPEDAITSYLKTSRSSGNELSPGHYDLSQRDNFYDPGKLYIRSIELLDQHFHPVDRIGTSQPLHLRIQVNGMSTIPRAMIGIIVKSQTDDWLAAFNTGMRPPRPFPRAQRECVTLSIPRFPFVPGDYWIDVSIAQGMSGRCDYAEHAAKLCVEPFDVYGSGRSVSARDGVVYLDGDWTIEPASDEQHPTLFAADAVSSTH